MKILHTTISGNRFNTFHGIFGFKLEVNREQERVYIKIKRLSDEHIYDDEIYYSYDDLRRIVEVKCDYIAFITAEHRTVNDTEQFYFKNAKLLSGLTFEKFLEFVENGTILYDIRIGVYRSGSNIGKTHDHGSGFRIKKTNISTVF
jgi:hypothetical protein